MKMKKMLIECIENGINAPNINVLRVKNDN